MLRLIGCGCSQSGTLRTAGRLDLHRLCSGSHGCLGFLNCGLLTRSRRRCRYCCWWWREALCQPGTRTELVWLDDGGGERPASPAAGRTEALCSCTSCCKGAPCLCCCGERKQGRDEELVYESVKWWSFWLLSTSLEALLDFTKPASFTMLYSDFTHNFRFFSWSKTNNVFLVFLLPLHSSFYSWLLYIVYVTQPQAHSFHCRHTSVKTGHKYKYSCFKRSDKARPSSLLVKTPYNHNVCGSNQT